MAAGRVPMGAAVVVVVVGFVIAVGVDGIDVVVDVGVDVGVVAAGRRVLEAMVTTARASPPADVVASEIVKVFDEMRPASRHDVVFAFQSADARGTLVE